LASASDKSKKRGLSTTHKVVIGIVVGIAVLVLAGILFAVRWQKTRKQHALGDNNANTNFSAHEKDGQMHYELYAGHQERAKVDGTAASYGQAANAHPFHAPNRVSQGMHGPNIHVVSELGTETRQNHQRGSVHKISGTPRYELG
jgi:hypothetical protein